MLGAGTLIRILVNVDLIGGQKISPGDLGIIISNDVNLGEAFYTKYDYEVLINECVIFVFCDEIEEAT